MSLGRPCLLLLTLSLVLAWVAPVSAGGFALPIVTIDDLTDVVTATGNGTAQVSGESVVFHSNIPLAGIPGFHLETLFITEGGCLSGSCPVSDRLATLDDEGVNIGFASDVDSSPFPNANCTPFNCVAETGGLQDVTAFFFFQTVPGAPSSGVIFFESDVEARVPAPATLLLLGCGLVRLGGLRWRRGRRT